MDKTDKKTDSSKARKVVRIILNVLLYTFFALCLVVLIMTIAAKRDSDGAVTVFGHQVRIVVTGSMEKSSDTDVSGFEIKSINRNSAIFIEVAPQDIKKEHDWFAKIKVGDVLTFKYKFDKVDTETGTNRPTITHRVISIEEKSDGGFIIKLRGDNNLDGAVTSGIQTIDTTTTDPQGQLNYVIGKVTGQSYFLGLILTALKSPLGMSLLIIVPCAIIIVIEFIRIASAINAHRREKLMEQTEAQAETLRQETEAKEEKEREIEELKRQLEALKNGSAPPEQAQPEQEPQPAPQSESENTSQQCNPEGSPNPDGSPDEKI